ncbi:MAG TPA: GNAT family N-acetyltransferase [Candidatus Limnocylindrales bacterium]|nr:GNAT family N-acetyltransferase [Candidatus Limnocylindrales bacterium]
MTGARRAFDIRPATRGDATQIADVWLASWRATFDFEPAHPDDEVRRWVREELLVEADNWVATDPSRDEAVMALLGLSDTMVEQLYVRPEWIGRGVGRELLDLAKRRRPDGLELYCFAANGRARRFYERNGFVPVAFGDGSGNEERQPDVLYRWRPS